MRTMCEVDEMFGKGWYWVIHGEKFYAESKGFYPTKTAAVIGLEDHLKQFDIKNWYFDDPAEER